MKKNKHHSYSENTMLGSGSETSDSSDHYHSSHTAGWLDALGSIPVNGATVCFLVEWGVEGVNFA